MVTASQLQLLQSPITALISSIPTSVNVKLDDSNYLNWNFQMQLLLESNGIMGYVDGSTHCPPQLSSTSCESGITSSQNDEFIVWKMHDRAIMQLITATLSSIAMSCAIGSTSSKDLWNRLKEQFSTVSRTSIFQMKSNLQTIKKGADSVSQYLHRIKEARDYLSAAGVYFADEDIVILALNGLPTEYNTFRCVIRGRESVISLHEFRSQLLAEEVIVEASAHSPLLTAMAATTGFPVNHSSSSTINRGFKPYSGNRNTSRGRFNQGNRHFHSRPVFSSMTHERPHSNSGVLGPSPNQQFHSHSASMMHICQLCNTEGHTAPFCDASSYPKQKCHICGRLNHTTWFCFYNDKGPNYIGMHSTAYSSQQPYPTQSPAMQQSSYRAPSPHPSFSSAQFPDSQPTMQAMHTMLHPAPSASNSSGSSQVWLTDSGATNHMTADLNNLTLASPYPTADTIHTANGEGLTVSHVGQSIINSSMSSFKLDSVLLVPQLTQNLLSVHRLCLDNNCWLIFDASCFWIQDKATRRILYRGLCSNGLYPIHASSSSSFTQPSPAQAFLGQLVQSNLWHHRLGHPTNSVVSLMLNKAHIPVPKTSSPIMCHPCLAGKVRKLPFPQHHHKFNSPFATIHTDLWGPAPCRSVDGYRYYTIFVDECTRFCWLFPLVNKSDLFSTFVAFYNLLVTQYSATVKILQSDGGGIYMQSFTTISSCQRHYSSPLLSTHP